MTELEQMRWWAGGIAAFILSAIALAKRYPKAGGTCIVLAVVCLFCLGFTSW